MSDFLRLGKWTISVPVALTGFLGYFLYQPLFDLQAILVISGVFLLSMGSSALNQIQERHTDALMKRTAGRPLPAGRLSLNAAILFVVFTSLSGTLLLFLTGSWVPAALGLFTLAWYNLVYTPLKRITAFAVLPGALIGAMPPLIGWSAAGGHPGHMEIVAVAFLLFVGQMPHYWLLLVKIGKEFQEAGLPVITGLMEPGQIKNLSFIWIAATGVIVLMLPATPVMHHRSTSLVLIIAAVTFLVRMFGLIYRGDLMGHWKKAFITVNLFYLTIILVLITDRVIG